MSLPLYVQWKILGADTLHIERHCAGCGRNTPFVSTEKFRLNANGNRLDAWLVYACPACGNRWNRTLFERRPVRSLPQATIEALQENDAGFARAFAVQPPRRTDGFRRGTAGPFRIEKNILSLARSVDDTLDLVLLNPANLHVRLDRVLAEGLAVSRATVHKLAATGVFRSPLMARKVLRQAIRERSVLEMRGLNQHVLPDLHERLLRQGQTQGE
ncbi:DUF1062 domain-containing protein [Roseibium sp.]|uniref:DUF1062 domain-containing protein n=1 Tax=Roseibium sp. TaxID=1936156 RepID=UPI003BAA39D3